MLNRSCMRIEIEIQDDCIRVQNFIGYKMQLRTVTELVVHSIGFRFGVPSSAQPDADYVTLKDSVHPNV
jgi:hypothetical protein